MKKLLIILMLVLCACGNTISEDNKTTIFIETTPNTVTNISTSKTVEPTLTPEPTTETIVTGLTAFEGEGSIKDYLYNDSYDIVYSGNDIDDKYTFSYGYAYKESLTEEVIAQWQEYFQENNNVYSTITYADDIEHGCVLTKDHIIKDIYLVENVDNFDINNLQYDGTGNIKDKVYTNYDMVTGKIYAFVSVPFIIYNSDIYQSWKEFYQQGEYDFYILLFPDLKLSDAELNEYGLLGNGYVHYHGAYFDGVKEVNPGIVSSPIRYVYDAEKIYEYMNIDQNDSDEEYTNYLTNQNSSFTSNNTYNLDTSDWRIQLALSYEGTYQGLCTFFATIYAMDIGLGPGFGQRISESELSVGDVILYFDANETYMHIATYIGNGYALHGNYNNDGFVKIAPVHIGYAKEVYCKRGDSFEIPYPSGANGAMDANAINAYYAYLDYYGQ